MKEEPVLRFNHETEALYLSKGHKVIWSGNSFFFFQQSPMRDFHNWDQQNCDQNSRITAKSSVAQLIDASSYSQ